MKQLSLCNDSHIGILPSGLAEFVTDKYRKMVFNKRYILIYQIKGETVYIEFVIDGRQDYQWLLNSPE